MKDIIIPNYTGSTYNLLTATPNKTGTNAEQIAYYARNIYLQSDESTDVFVDDGGYLGSMGVGGGPPDMILVYEIPAPSTDIQLAIQANSTYFSAGQEVSINWGDGSAAEPVSDTGGSTYIGHTYASAGTYTIKISGSMTMYGRSGNVDILGQTLLTRVDSFGKLGLTSFTRAFQSCVRLASVPKTLPSDVTDTSYMFRNCAGASFNPDISNWDMSKVENMNSMFQNCYRDAFNPDVTNWNVSKVTNMTNMFRNCSGAAFNPDMKSWTLKTDVTTTYMFTDSKTQPTTWLDELLIAWAANPAQGNNITINFSPNSFSETTEGEPIPAVAAALATLIGKGWSITTANPYPAP